MEGVIHIIGQIGSFDEVKGVELIDVISQVKSQPEATSFRVFIKSEGGLVDVGFDIYNYIKSLNVPIRTIAVGELMSIATVIFTAGEIRELSPIAQTMIHLPWGGIEGTAEDIKAYGYEISKTEKRLIDHYKSVLGLTEEAIRPLLKNETYLTNEQALSIGFATTISESTTAKAYINLKPDNMSTITKEELDKKFQKHEGILNKLLSTISKHFKPKALLLQDANGDEIDFTDVAEDAEPKVGDKATLNGAPVPDGDYIFPSWANKTVTFVDSAVTEIKDKEDTTDLEAENKALKEKVEALEAQNSKTEQAFKEVLEGVKAMKKEFSDFKKTVGGSFNYNPDVDGNKGKPEQGARKRTPLKK